MTVAKSSRLLRRCWRRLRDFIRLMQGARLRWNIHSRGGKRIRAQRDFCQQHRAWTHGDAFLLSGLFNLEKLSSANQLPPLPYPSKKIGRCIGPTCLSSFARSKTLIQAKNLPNSGDRRATRDWDKVGTKERKFLKCHPSSPAASVNQ
jgi:hypothetical protein